MPLMRLQEIMNELRAGGRLTADDWALVCEMNAICLMREDAEAKAAAERRARDRERKRVSTENSAENSTDASIILNNKQEGGVGETKSEVSTETPRTILKTVLDDTHADAVLEHRRAKRSPLKTHSARLLAKQLGKFPDPNAAADEMIERGWQTIKRDWMKDPPGKILQFSASPPKRSWAEIKAERSRP